MRFITKISVCFFMTNTLWPMEVLPDGSFNYEIPIELPPGVGVTDQHNGMAPQLALQYNSGLPNGILGVGRQLKGLSHLQRINAGGGILFKGKDVLAGPEGLIGQYTDAQNQMSYRAENERFSKYTPSTEICFDMPCSFFQNRDKWHEILLRHQCRQSCVFA